MEISAVFAYVRAPLLSMDAADGVFSATSWDNLRQSLELLLEEHPALLAAVAVASPSLFDEIRKSGLSSPLVVAKVASYAVRAAHRSTPLGLFAGVSAMSLRADRAPVRMSGNERIHADVDAAWLHAFVQRYGDVEQFPQRLALNPLVYRRGNRMVICSARHVEKIESSGMGGTYFKPVSIARTAPVAFVETTLAGGPLQADALMHALADRFDVPIEKSASLVRKLSDVGFLISELIPSALVEPLPYTSSIISGLDDAGRENLEEIGSAMSALTDVPLDRVRHSDVACVYQLQERLTDARGINAALDVAIDGSLPRRVVEDAEKLVRLSMRMRPSQSMHAFRERFYKRYESAERLVPLLEFADIEWGVGTAFNVLPDDAPARFAERVNRFCAEVIQQTGRSRERELSDQDLENILLPEAEHSEMLDSSEFGIEIIAGTPEDLKSGEYLLAPCGIGTHAVGRNGARFINAFREPLRTEYINAARAAVLDRDAVVAELAFMPTDARALNVMLHPRIAQYVIPLNTAAVPDGASILRPSELYVGMRDGRFYLYSAQIEKMVVVAENHVVNVPDMTDNVTRFLSLLAIDGKRFPDAFDWGPFSAAPYRPRLRWRNFVLSRAAWSYAKNERVTEHILEDVRAGRLDSKVVLLENIGVRTFIDLDSLIGRRMLEECVRKHPFPRIVFEEDLSARSAWLRDQNNRPYRSETVMSFVHDKPRGEQSPFRPAAVASDADRLFAPGSDWTFVKLYAPESEHDRLMTALAAVTRRFDATSVPWFFLRFSDPAAHLRLRLRLPLHKPLTSVLLECLRQFVTDRRADNFSIATYVREIERYGGEHAIDVAEDWFCYDSQLVLKLLPHCATTSDRMFHALQSFEPTRRAFAYTDEEWLEQHRRHNVKLAPEEWAIVKRLDREPPVHIPGAQEVADRYLRLEGSGHLKTPLTDVTSAFMHMHCNRFGLSMEERVRAIQWRWIQSRVNRSNRRVMVSA